MKRIISVILICLMLSGCYDMVDVENIENISLICIDNSKIYYCLAVSDGDDKIFDFYHFAIQSNDLYYGIDKISEQTGKKVSMSHVGGVIFSIDCDYELIKKSVNALLKGTNSHPKIMTAFYEGDFESLFSQVKSDGVFSTDKLIDKILQNKFDVITKCTAIDLSCGLNFDISGKRVPVMRVIDNSIDTSASMFVNSRQNIRLDESLTAFLNMVQNQGENVYYNFDNKNIGVSADKINFDFKYGQAEFDISVSSNEDQIILLLNECANKVTEYYNNGFDMLNVREKLKKYFLDIRLMENYLKNNKIKLKINIRGED